MAAATPAYDPRHLRAVSELVTVDSRDAYCSAVRLFVKSIAGDYKWVSIYILLLSILFNKFDLCRRVPEECQLDEPKRVIPLFIHCSILQLGTELCLH